MIHHDPRKLPDCFKPRFRKDPSDPTLVLKKLYKDNPRKVLKLNPEVNHGTVKLDSGFHRCQCKEKESTECERENISMIK